MTYLKLTISKSIVVVLLVAQIFSSVAFAQESEDDFMSSAALDTIRRTAAVAKLTAAATAATISAAAVAAPEGLPVMDKGIQAIAAAAAAKDLAGAKKELAEAEANIFEGILKAIKKTIFETLKKRILDMMVDQIIVWIQGGGDPQFVIDWQGFFQEAAGAVAGDFSKELGLGFLCSPFSLQLRLSMLPVERFTERASCTLDRIVGNIQNFYDDFRNGGWIAFDSSLQMNNNYFGALWYAWDERNNRIADALFAKDREVITGKGFLSTKRCYDKNTGYVYDNKHEGEEGVVCEIVTPGDTIGSIVSDAIYGSSIGWLLSSNDLTHYVAAIANAAINRMISEGAGLLGARTPSAPRFQRGTAIGSVSGAGNFPADVDATSRQLQSLSGSFGSQLSSLGSIDAVALEERLRLEVRLGAALQDLYNCRREAADAVGKIQADATKRDLDTQTTLIVQLQNTLTTQRAIIADLNINVGRAESRNNVALQQQVLQRYANAAQVSNQARQDLSIAQSTIPQKLTRLDDDLKACRTKLR